MGKVEWDVGKRMGGGGEGEDDVEGEEGDDGGDDTRSVGERTKPVRPTQWVTQGVRVKMRRG